MDANVDPEQAFYDHLGNLGQWHSLEGRQRAVSSVFSAMKTLMEPDERSAVESLLPPWLREKWLASEPGPARVIGADVVDLIKSHGDYGYRGAAERTLRAVFGSLVEVLEGREKERLATCLPEEMRTFWSESNACSLGQTMGQYL